MSADTTPNGFVAGEIYQMIVLGHHDGKYVLYDRGGDRVHVAADDAVTVVRHPVGTPR
ncbi:hypothetical protein OHA72_06365 [Dactylosporangium sp. NBC_01737]|uniref:hypothetical protein n=1 Tax=Dactylosporangium sp. NBC_01737 TaxID=2975959 RepID=UPI002E128C67|nr:hypothetical protein OHA72_06365 [Dactylosporangium sp. NBC_01737]